MINFRKILIAGVAIASIGAAMAASTTEASAHPGWGGGWGGGGFGWGLGALAVGAAAAAATAASDSYYNDDCYYANRKVYNDYGDFIGYRRVEVCN